MKISNYVSKIIVTVSFSLMGSLSLLVGLNSVASAQINSEATGAYQKNEQSTTGSSTFGNDFNPMNLIHNANLRRSRGGDEFRQDTANELDRAAEEFKKLQQQRLQEAQSADNVAPQQ
jgi:hypothetical protein